MKVEDTVYVSTIRGESGHFMLETHGHLTTTRVEKGHVSGGTSMFAVL